nr:hypothetical protein [Tanacetum cinerariifolium]
MEDRFMLNNSQGKKQEVEDHRRNVKFSKNKMSVTACNDSLKPKTSNVNFVCTTSGKCVLNENHDMCVLKSLDGVKSRTKMPIAVPVSTREPKRTVKQSVAKLLRKTVALESNQKPRNITRKLYEHTTWIYLSKKVVLLREIHNLNFRGSFDERLYDEKKFPLPVKKVPTARRKEMLLPRGLHYWESVPLLLLDFRKDREEERSNMAEVTPDNTEKPTAMVAEMPVMEAETKNKAQNGAENKTIKTPENEETVEASSSQPIAYYLKHKINEKLIKGTSQQ